MIRTSITPQHADILISVPPQYIGRKLEVLLYAVEEITEQVPKPTTMAQFWGILSDEAAQDLREASTRSREEWDRSI